MDVSDASYYIFNEKGNKGSQMGHTKKKFKKKQTSNTCKTLQEKPFVMGNLLGFS
jgi:hypothetical protein